MCGIPLKKEIKNRFGVKIGEKYFRMLCSI